MALVDSTLETALISIFASMGSMTSGGDAYLAKNMALAIKSYILTATVSTTDAGTVGGTSVYAGSGTGLPGCFVIDNTALETNLLNCFTAENVTDADIGNGIADSIDSACSQQNIISTSTNGTLTPPSGTPGPYSGTGKGTFTGLKTTISQKLLGLGAIKGTFEKMNEMTSGGDALFAKDLAGAIGDYLRNGSVTVVLDSPITGGGTGGVE